MRRTGRKKAPYRPQRDDNSSAPSESTLGDYRNDPVPQYAEQLLHPGPSNSYDSVISQLNEDVSNLKTEIRKLKEQKKNILTEEEKKKLSDKQMLQIIDVLDKRNEATKDDVYLFLKALSSGEKCVNVRIGYKITHHLTEHLRKSGSEKNIVTVFDYPVSVNGWSVQFESELSPDFVAPYEPKDDGINSFTLEWMVYNIVLTMPEKKKMKIVAQENDENHEERKDRKLVSIKTSRETEDLVKFGVKMYRIECQHSGVREFANIEFAEQLPNGESWQTTCITWTVVNEDA